MKSRIDKLEYKLKINNTARYYYKNNDYHREKDLPAKIWLIGTRAWFKNGKQHRDNGKPSSIYFDGYMEWYEDDNYIKGEY